MANSFLLFLHRRHLNLFFVQNHCDSWSSYIRCSKIGYLNEMCDRRLCEDGKLYSSGVDVIKNCCCTHTNTFTTKNRYLSKEMSARSVYRMEMNTGVPIVIDSFFYVFLNLLSGSSIASCAAIYNFISVSCYEILFLYSLHFCYFLGIFFVYIFLLYKMRCVHSNIVRTYFREV